jgi:hypothetical protein
MTIHIQPNSVHCSSIKRLSALPTNTRSGSLASQPQQGASVIQVNLGMVPAAAELCCYSWKASGS